MKKLKCRLCHSLPNIFFWQKKIFDCKNIGLKNQKKKNQINQILFFFLCGYMEKNCTAFHVTLGVLCWDAFPLFYMAGSPVGLHHDFCFLFFQNCDTLTYSLNSIPEFFPRCLTPFDTSCVYNFFIFHINIILLDG